MNHHRVECYPHAAHHCHCLCVFMAYFGMEQSGCLILLAAPVGVHVRCARMVEPDAIQLAIRAQLAINRRAWHWSRFTWRWIFSLLRVACRLQHIFSVFSSFFSLVSESINSNFFLCLLRSMSLCCMHEYYLPFREEKRKYYHNITPLPNHGIYFPISQANTIRIIVAVTLWHQWQSVCALIQSRNIHTT